MYKFNNSWSQNDFNEFRFQWVNSTHSNGMEYTLYNLFIYIALRKCEWILQGIFFLLIHNIFFFQFISKAKANWLVVVIIRWDFGICIFHSSYSSYLSCLVESIWRNERKYIKHAVTILVHYIIHENEKENYRYFVGNHFY